MDNEPIETIEYKDHTIKIFQDLHCDNPRDRDMDDGIITQLHTCHSRYSFDKEFDYKTGEDCRKAVKKCKRQGDIVMPLYIYDHSGITISLKPFSSVWDSGQLGFVVVPRLEMIKHFGKKIFTPKLKERALKVAKQEVECYDEYLRGEVYGYVIDDNEDSCWGYYGSDKAQMIGDAKGSIDYIIKYEKQEAELFTYIKKWADDKHSDTVILSLMQKEPMVSNETYAKNLFAEYREKRIKEMALTLKDKKYDHLPLWKVERLIIKVDV